jgi:acetyl-CoA carboxylase/biotin carboxylase 1
MEAKGCAKRMEWTNARRYFYWSVRGRVPRSSALGKLAEANPNLTYDQRREILDVLLSLDPGASPQAVAEAYEAVDLRQTISRLKSEYLLGELVALAEGDKQATIDGLTKLISGLGGDTKSALLSALRS